MRSKNLFFVWRAAMLFALPLLALSSCSEDLAGENRQGTDPNAEYTDVTFNFSSDEGGETRAEGTVTGDADSAINDVWVLQYQGTAGATDDNYSLCQAVYARVAGGVASVPLVTDNTKRFKIYCIVNTGSAGLFDTNGSKYAAISTLTKLKTLAKTTDPNNIENEIWKKTGTPTLLMRGVGSATFGDADTSAAKELTITSASIPAIYVRLYRLYARINFSYTCDFPDKATRSFKVVSIQLKNAPAQLGYFNDATPTAYVDYAVLTLNDESKAARSFTYYVPANILGSHTQAYPDKSTCIEIVCWDGTAGKPVAYLFYPHADSGTNKYNIVPNTTYEYKTSLKGGKATALTAGTDYAIESVNPYAVTVSSNCYMFASKGAQSCFFSFPITQVNEYNKWRATNGKGSAVLADADAWTTDILWTDVPGMVAFLKGTGTGYSGNNGYIIGRASFSGKQGGNAVVQVKKSGTVVWSFHLWFLKTSPGTTAYTPANTASDGNPSNYTYSFLNYNLGATNNDVTSTADTKSFGLYYQWGRKYPVPATGNPGETATGYYAGSGLAYTIPAAFTPTGTDNLSQSILEPGTFIKFADDSALWFGSDGDRSWDLLGSAYAAEVYTASKTIFDPCPPGYQVPPESAYGTELASNSGSSYWKGKGYDWTTITGGRTSAGPGKFSAAGYRWDTNGTRNNVWTEGIYWTTLRSYFSANGCVLKFTSSNSMPRESLNRSFAFPVRCVASNF